MQKQYTVAELLKLFAQELNNITDSPTLEAEILLAHVLKRGRAALRAWPDDVCTDEQLRKSQQLLARRLTGEPIAYIFELREFWSLEFKVTPATLIPRPETEMLVEQALKLATQYSHPRIIDAGTGSGAIAIAIKKELPEAIVFASDRSRDALVVAKENANRNDVEVLFVQANWLDPFRDGSFDIVVSNPPYIAETDPHLAQGDVRFEPRTALVALESGLSDIKRLVEQGVDKLKPSGHLLLEHGWQQGEAVRNIFNDFQYESALTIRDYSGHERLTCARRV